MIGNTWLPYYSTVSHISSPHAVWIEGERHLFLYFHGENSITRYATSDDGIHFSYGGTAVSRDDTTGGETSYARVFEQSVPRLGTRYLMLFMDNPTAALPGPTGPVSRRIRWAVSNDARTWAMQPEPIVTPQGIEGPNASGPFFLRWDDRNLVIYHAADGNMHAVDVGQDFDQEIHLGVVHDSMSAAPDLGRSAAPTFYFDGRTAHMYYEAGGRLTATIGHATATLANPLPVRQLDCVPDRPVLWPPNHKLVDVNVTVDLHDGVLGPNAFTLASVTGGDAADVSGFATGTPDTSGRLRAERAGNAGYGCTTSRTPAMTRSDGRWAAPSPSPSHTTRAATGRSSPAVRPTTWWGALPGVQQLVQRPGSGGKTAARSRAPGEVLPESTLRPGDGRGEFLQIQAGGPPHPVEEVDEVLGGGVSGRRRCERATACSADAGVEGCDARLDCRDRVGHAGVPGVVQVQPQRCAGLRDLPGERQPFGKSEGTATPMVSARASSSGPASRTRVSTSLRRFSGTSPSNGHPNEAPTVTVVNTPASRAACTSTAAVSQAWAVVMPWLRPQKVSVATTTTLISSTPAAESSVQAAAVHHQARVSDAVVAGERGHQLVRVRHLRNAGGVDETGHLHPPGSRAYRPLGELHLVGGGE